MRSKDQDWPPKVDSLVESKSIGIESGYQKLLFLTFVCLSCYLSFFSNFVNAQTEPLNSLEAEKPQAANQWNIEADSQPAALADEESANEEDLEPSAKEEPLAEEEPLARQEPLMEAKPSAEEEPSDQQESQIQATDSSEQLDITPEPQLTKPTLNISSQLSADLEQQFLRVRSRLETENAFSEVLGEEYLSYGLLLLKAGRLDEARKMIVDALHIAKVNNGIYSAEQLPVLHALFDVHMLMGDAERFEDTLTRIVWLENYVSDPPHTGTFRRLVKAGNYFLDEFLYKPVANEQTLLYLDNADKYLSAAVTFFGRRPISEMLMPYGELALANYHKSQVSAQVSNTHAAHSFQERSRPILINTSRTFKSRLSSGSDTFNKRSGYALTRGEYFLRQYFSKASDEENTEQIVNALINLGDVNLLFNQPREAADYYQHAWQEAQKLPESHDLIASFKQPVKLPAFNYSQPRDVSKTARESVYIPLTFNVTDGGKVKKVAPLEEGVEVQYYSRARRAARRFLFRPVIDNGKMVGANQFTHDVRVLVRRRKTEG